VTGLDTVRSFLIYFGWKVDRFRCDIAADAKMTRAAIFVKSGDPVCVSHHCCAGKA
jgi:hypothetical protein